MKWRSRPSLAELARFCAPHGGRFAVGRFTGDVARPATGANVKPRVAVRHVVYIQPDGAVASLCAVGYAVEMADGDTDAVTCGRCFTTYLDGGFRRRRDSAPWWETPFVPLERVS